MFDLIVNGSLVRSLSPISLSTSPTSPNRPRLTQFDLGTAHQGRRGFDASAHPPTLFLRVHEISFVTVDAEKVSHASAEIVDGGTRLMLGSKLNVQQWTKVCVSLLTLMLSTSH